MLDYQAFRDVLGKGQLQPGLPGIAEFLDRFFMSRISLRFLYQQHLQVSQAASEGRVVTASGPHRWVGAIDSKCDIVHVAKDAAFFARERCFETYGDAPEIDIVTPGLPKGQNVGDFYSCGLAITCSKTSDCD